MVAVKIPMAWNSFGASEARPSRTCSCTFPMAMRARSLRPRERLAKALTRLAEKRRAGSWLLRYGSVTRAESSPRPEKK